MENSDFEISVEHHFSRTKLNYLNIWEVLHLWRKVAVLSEDVCRTDQGAMGFN